MWDRIFAEFVSLDWLLTEIATKYSSISSREISESERPA
jgi:hypothetical protein